MIPHSSFRIQHFWEQPESRRLEFKEILPKGEQLAKTVIALAYLLNKSG